MTDKIAPFIPQIPDETVLDAHRLGMVVELHAQTMAGHGITGRVAWSIRKPNGEHLPSARSGDELTADRALARMREVLDDLAETGLSVARRSELAHAVRLEAAWIESQDVIGDAPYDGWRKSHQNLIAIARELEA